MASPFPGMDPYLESFWGDIHHTLITYARDQLQGVLPGDLRARVEERVFVELPEGQKRAMYPDIRVVERGHRKRAVPATASGVAVAEPLCIRLPDEPVTQGFIEIIDLTTGRRVVTVLEVLSPSNKIPGPGRKLYQQKQRECREGGVNLVEIDLLRAGPWVLTVPESMVPASYCTTFRVCVYRAAGTLGEIYRVPLRKRLPVIEVPLRESDADVPLDVQALVDQCYRNGGYDEDISYRDELEPPLAPGDRRWADALLRKHGRRAVPAARKQARDRRRRKPKS
ncbi:MAG TPA: DUF4058 family protein [Pirellulales bacterium]|nr:DUF4058 family protein [Pirellulales bacterium]